MAQSGIAAGAQAGAAFGPWGAAIGGALGGVSDAVGAAMGGPFMGGSSTATYGASMFDNSGWTVNIGAGSASATSTQTKAQEQTRAADQFAGGLGYPSAPAMQAGLNPVLMVVMGGVLLAVLMRKRGGK